MEPFVHDVPASRVVFGPGRRRELGAELARLGVGRALVVGRFETVVMHVPVEVAARATDSARSSEADVVVALGGGSAVGTAKAVAKETGIPVVAIPTTYAGSEMTPIWGLTQNRRKVTGRDPGVLPKVVVYDPELTTSLPPGLTATSGMNAMAHLVEGLYAPGVSPLQTLTAQEGVRALAAGLPGVVRHPEDLEHRSDVMYGAWLGGWILGTAGMGVHHRICHVLGGTYDLPHAPSHSVVLPYVLAANARAAPRAVQALEQALRAAGREVDHAPGALWDLRHEVGATESLAEIGFTAAEVDEAADLVVHGEPVNPRRVDHAMVAAVLADAVAGRRPGPWFG
jgi:maleylacetate reductase